MVTVLSIIHGLTLALRNVPVQDTLSSVAVKIASAAVVDDLRVTLSVAWKIKVSVVQTV